MSEQKLNLEERNYLLKLARDAISQAIHHGSVPEVNMATLTDALKAEGASFITLTLRGHLRGCIGALEPYQPLAIDVREHAVAAALEDYRFSPLSEAELDDVRIEISRLTVPKLLAYKDGDDLIRSLHPGIDGVILADGYRKATFLPQVWEQLPNPEEFLSHLCVKMGSNPDAWRGKHLEVALYQVEEFHE